MSRSERNRMAAVWVLLVLTLFILVPVSQRFLPPAEAAGSFSSGDWKTDVALGRYPGYSRVARQGSGTVTVAFAPITLSGFYRMPTTPTALEVFSDSPQDAAGGSGASEVTILGIGSDWRASEPLVVALNGTNPVAFGSLLRVTEWYVSASGSYAAQAAGSQVGTLTIREAGGGPVWSVIGLVDGVAQGKSMIGADTIPAGKTGWIESFDAIVDSAKAIDAYLFCRCEADDVTAPYSGTMQIFKQMIGLDAQFLPVHKYPIGPFRGPCDIWFLAKVAANDAQAAVSFEILLLDN